MRGAFMALLKTAFVLQSFYLLFPDLNQPKGRQREFSSDENIPCLFTHCLRFWATKTRLAILAFCPPTTLLAAPVFVCHKHVLLTNFSLLPQRAKARSFRLRNGILPVSPKAHKMKFF